MRFRLRRICVLAIVVMIAIAASIVTTYATIPGATCADESEVLGCMVGNPDIAAACVKKACEPTDDCTGGKEPLCSADTPAAGRYCLAVSQPVKCKDIGVVECGTVREFTCRIEPDSDPKKCETDPNTGVPANPPRVCYVHQCEVPPA